MSRPAVPTASVLQEARQALDEGRPDLAMQLIGRATLRLAKGDDMARRQLADLADVVVMRAFRRVVH